MTKKSYFLTFFSQNNYKKYYIHWQYLLPKIRALIITPRYKKIVCSSDFKSPLVSNQIHLPYKIQIETLPWLRLRGLSTLSSIQDILSPVVALCHWRKLAKANSNGGFVLNDICLPWQEVVTIEVQKVHFKPTEEWT